MPVPGSTSVNPVQCPATGSRIVTLLTRTPRTSVIALAGPEGVRR
jgi:hypothetical protein